MLRTSRSARRGQAALVRLAELRLPRDERRAARAEREVERQMRLERDNTQYTPWARAAALDAERQRWGGAYGRLSRDR
jgi:hypothetical protein